MADEYVTACEEAGYPGPADVADDEREETEEAIVEEFKVFLQTWQLAWKQSRQSTEESV